MENKATKKLNRKIIAVSALTVLSIFPPFSCSRGVPLRPMWRAMTQNLLRASSTTATPP